MACNAAYIHATMFLDFIQVHAETVIDGKSTSEMLLKLP